MFFSVTYFVTALYTNTVTPSIIPSGSHFYSHLFDSLKDLVILLEFICQGWIGWQATHLLKKQIKIAADLKWRRISVSLGTVKNYFSHMSQFYWFAIGHNSYDVNTNLNVITQLLLVMADIWRVNVLINQVLFCSFVQCFILGWPLWLVGYQIYLPWFKKVYLDYNFVQSSVILFKIVPLPPSLLQASSFVLPPALLSDWLGTKQSHPLPPAKVAWRTFANGHGVHDFYGFLVKKFKIKRGLFSARERLPGFLPLLFFSKPESLKIFSLANTSSALILDDSRSLLV